jgi:probable F420-dependent oxidoreductase
VTYPSARSCLGSIGIWSAQVRHGDPVEVLEAAVELDELGFDTLWIPDAGGAVMASVERLLQETPRITIATGILNIWMQDAGEVARDHARIDAAHPERFVMGLGVSHAPLIDADAPGRYRRPYTRMVEYLDELDANRPEGHRPARLLAALAPRMLELAAQRTLGIHPYLVPVAHTRWAREQLGDGPVIAPSLTVILEADPAKARAIARNDAMTYLGLPNYVNTWRRLGYGDDDFAGNGTDAFIDSLYAHGTVDDIADRIEAHRGAGADHVCLRVVTDHPDDHLRPPREEWRRLAERLV